MINPHPDSPSLTRRESFKALAAVSAATLLSSKSAWSQETAPQKAGVPLTIAGYDFDRVKPLADGAVQVAGCDVTFVKGRIGDMNIHVFSGKGTRDVTEIGLHPFMLAYANEDFRDYILIPVFPLRTFRHKSIYIRTDRGIKRPKDLKGKKVATPGFSSTSLTWIRGFLQHEYGVKMDDLHWVVAQADSSEELVGKVSAQESMIPEGLNVIQGPEGKDESEMLADGDVDALLHAAEPQAFVDGDPNVGRLFADFKQAEQAYYRKTGIFPIMHTVAIRRKSIEAHPWLPKAVFNAYVESKALAMKQLDAMGWAYSSLPWITQELEDTRALMGDNFWPYGIEANRKVLEALFQYSHEQNLAGRRLTIEELFEPSTLALLDG